MVMSLREAFTLSTIQDYLKEGIPVMVAWNDWGGHWQVIIGWWYKWGQKRSRMMFWSWLIHMIQRITIRMVYVIYPAERFYYNFTMYDFFPEEELNDMLLLPSSDWIIKLLIVLKPALPLERAGFMFNVRHREVWWNGLLLLLPFFLIRFLLLSRLDQQALGRAAHFVPMPKTEKGFIGFIRSPISLIFILILVLPIKRSPSSIYYMGLLDLPFWLAGFNGIDHQLCLMW